MVVVFINVQGGEVVFWPWAECVVALFIYLSAIITKAKLTRIGACVLGEPQIISYYLIKKPFLMVFQELKNVFNTGGKIL